VRKDDQKAETWGQWLEAHSAEKKAASSASHLAAHWAFQSVARKVTEKAARLAKMKVEHWAESMDS
jgi:hypothetical protein